MECMRSRTDSGQNDPSWVSLGKIRGCGFISVLLGTYPESIIFLVFNKYLFNERHFLEVMLPYWILCVHMLSHFSHSALCDPMDRSPPGSSVHGILQARILEWVAIPFCRESSRLRDETWVSCIAGRFFSIQVTRKWVVLVKKWKQSKWPSINWQMGKQKIHKTEYWCMLLHGWTSETSC